MRGRSQGSFTPTYRAQKADRAIAVAISASDPLIAAGCGLESESQLDCDMPRRRATSSRLLKPPVVVGVALVIVGHVLRAPSVRLMAFLLLAAACAVAVRRSLRTGEVGGLLVTYSRRDESKIFRAAVTMIVVLGLQSFLTAVRILLGLLMRPPNP